MDETAYDELTDRDDATDTANPWGTSAYQRTFAWPATERVLPRVGDGDRVLLAGCGRGDHADRFLDRGATVVGIDAAGEPVAAARERHAAAGEAGRARFRQARLADASAAVAEPVDLIVSHLVVSHVESPAAAFAELRSVARDGAPFVCTTVHPRYLAQRAPTDGYAEPVAFHNDWDGTSVPTYYRPVSRLLTALARNGWRLDRVDEPEPPEAFREPFPDRYAAALDRPELLVVRAHADDPSDESVADHDPLDEPAADDATGERPSVDD